MIFHQPMNSRGNYTYDAVTYRNINWNAHFHKNYELIYVLEGTVHCTASGRERMLKPGDFGLILSNEVHSYRTVGQSLSWVLVFSGDFVHAFDKQAKNKTGSDFVFHCSEEIENHLKINLMQAERTTVFMLKSCLYAVCHEYCKAITLSESVAKSDLLMRSMIDYIANGYKEKISLSHMAEKLGYNYHYLSKCFHRIFDMSFTDFLNSYRLDAAIELLNETDKDMIEVAYESGFQSVRSFNSIFKARTGMTPAQYKKQNRIHATAFSELSN